MSEHTLDDLAARLEALGWTTRRDETNGCIYATTLEDNAQSESDIHWIELAPDWISLDVTITPNLWPALDTIRQWQASAEPAPPPTAPVVNFDLVAREQAVISAVMKLLLLNPAIKRNEAPLWAIDKADRELWRAADHLAALRGADLKPEGARDGQ